MTQFAVCSQLLLLLQNFPAGSTRNFEMLASQHLGRLRTLTLWLPPSERGTKIRSWKVDSVKVLDVADGIRSVEWFPSWVSSI